MQTTIPCVMMRGGTSKGPYFLASDLPEVPARRDQAPEVVRAALLRTTRRLMEGQVCVPCEVRDGKTGILADAAE